MATEKFALTDALGVPAMTPVELRVNPAGKAPELSAYVYGPVPPVAVRVWLYGVPTVPAGNDAGVNVSTGQIFKFTVCTA